jgi:hypothetical protein
MPDVKVLELLLSLDKYLSHMRKLRHAKSELVKSNFTAAKERNRLATGATVKERQTRLANTATTIAKTEVTANQSKMMASSYRVQIQNENKEIAENPSDVPESAACK